MIRSVLITGASSGIGAATARHLITRGFRVFGTSRSAERDRGIDEHGIEWLPLDVCDDASVTTAFAEAIRRGGALYGVVCNAGMGIFGSVEEVSIEAARDQFETNFFGTLRTVRAALPAMREAKRGRIVIVGSLSGRAPIPFQAHYSASKAALDALAMGLHNELHGSGVHVSLVEPGDIDTSFNDAMNWGSHDGSPYRSAIDRCEAVIRESLPLAPKPLVVARAIEKALTARRPRVRHACGADSFNVPFGRRFLPDRLFLSLIRRHFRL